MLTNAVSNYLVHFLRNSIIVVQYMWDKCIKMVFQLCQGFFICNPVCFATKEVLLLNGYIFEVYRLVSNWQQFLSHYLQTEKVMHPKILLY
jgi:hypothetical protein